MTWYVRDHAAHLDPAGTAAAMIDITVEFGTETSPVNLVHDEDTITLTPTEGWGSCRFNGPVVLMPKAGFETQAKDARFGRAVREYRETMPDWKRMVAHALGLA